MSKDQSEQAESAAKATMQQRGARSLQHISIWLFGMCVLVFLMVIVGGATRLTDSGLSITEWKPIIGAVPPLSESHWLSEFEKYKQIPEYTEVNYGMSLEQFKFIYWWEWGHRFLGRLIGLAFFVPFMVFMVTRQLNRSLSLKLFGLLILGGAQGFLGWYMVSSGLSDRVDVSQYRLAAHLGLAVLLFAFMAYMAIALRRQAKPNVDSPVFDLPKRLHYGAWVLAIGVYAQIILGAFVAGLRAGFTFNTWPLMDGQFFPAGYFSQNPRVADLFESIAAVQFNHRLGAYVLFFAVLWFAYTARKSAIAKQARWLLGAITFQALLGIVTLVSYTPLWLGLAHQAGAMIVLFIAIWTLQTTRTSPQGVGTLRSIDSSGSIKSSGNRVSPVGSS